MHTSRTILFLAIPFLLVACSAQAPSSAGLYGSQPVSQNIKGSKAQKVLTRTVPYTFDETYDAALQGMMRLGLNVEEQDDRVGKVAAGGMIAAQPTTIYPFTMAVYVEQISTRPMSKVTLVIDSHKFALGWDAAQLAGDKVMSEITRVLSTY